MDYGYPMVGYFISGAGNSMNPLFSILNRLGYTQPAQLVPTLTHALTTPAQSFLSTVLQTNPATAATLLAAAKTAFTFGNVRNGEKILANLLARVDPENLVATLAHHRLGVTSPVAAQRGRIVRLPTRTPTIKLPPISQSDPLRETHQAQLFEGLREKFDAGWNRFETAMTAQPNATIKEVFLLEALFQATLERTFNDGEGITHFTIQLLPDSHYENPTGAFPLICILEEMLNHLVDFESVAIDHETGERKWTPAPDLKELKGFEKVLVTESGGKNGERILVLTRGEEKIHITFDEKEGLILQTSQAHPEIKLLLETMFHRGAYCLAVTKQSPQLFPEPATGLSGAMAKGTPWQERLSLGAEVESPMTGADRVILGGMIDFGLGRENSGTRDPMNLPKSGRLVEPSKAVEYAQSMLSGKAEGFHALRQLVDDGGIIATTMGMEVALFADDFYANDFDDALRNLENLKASFVDKVEAMQNIPLSEQKEFVARFLKLNPTETESWIGSVQQNAHETLLKLAVLAQFIAVERKLRFEAVENQPNILTLFALSRSWQPGGKGSCHSMATLAMDLGKAAGLIFKAAPSEGHISLHLEVPHWASVLFDPATGTLYDEDHFIQLGLMEEGDLVQEASLLLMNPILMRLETEGNIREEEKQTLIGTLNRFFSSHPLALVHLANHFLRQGAIEAAESAIKAALRKNLSHLRILDVGIAIAEVKENGTLASSLRTKRSTLLRKRGSHNPETQIFDAAKKLKALRSSPPPKDQN